jgi:SHS2 domain-containing protein
MDKFKFLEHTADIKFQAFGKTMEEVFSNSALAMFNSMSEDSIEKNIDKEIEISGTDDENLLYNFLEELLFLFDSEGFFLSQVKKIKISKNRLVAEVVGDKAENYEIKVDVKAVTYNDMFVRKEKNNFVGQVVLDV